MKKTFFSIIGTGIITVLMHSTVHAQVALNKAANTANRFRMEAHSLLEPKTSSTASIDFRTLKDFSKRFTSINNAAWYPTDKGYIAEFSADSVKTTVAYGKNGKWFYTIHKYH